VSVRNFFFVVLVVVSQIVFFQGGVYGSALEMIKTPGGVSGIYLFGILASPVFGMAVIFFVERPRRTQY
jgi:hypothetical protein